MKEKNYNGVSKAAFNSSSTISASELVGNPSHVFSIRKFIPIEKHIFDAFQLCLSSNIIHRNRNPFIRSGCSDIRRKRSDPAGF